MSNSEENDIVMADAVTSSDTSPVTIAANITEKHAATDATTDDTDATTATSTTSSEEKKSDSSKITNGGSTIRYTMKDVNLPALKGTSVTQVMSFIRQAKLCFANCKGLSDEQKINFVGAVLQEPEAQNWFESITQSAGFDELSYDEFVTKFKSFSLGFGGMEQLILDVVNLRDNDTVEKFIRTFRNLKAIGSSATAEDFWSALFISNLRPSMRTQWRMQASLPIEQRCRNLIETEKLEKRVARDQSQVRTFWEDDKKTGHKRNRSRGSHKGGKRSKYTTNASDKSNTCHYCKKSGHWKSDCPDRKARH